MSQISTPRRPIIFFPALANASEVFFRDVYVDQLDASPFFRGPKRKRQYRVHRRKRPVSRPPSLNDQRPRLDVENFAGKHPIECAKHAAGPRLNGYGQSRKRRVRRRVEINVKELIRQRRKRGRHNNISWHMCKVPLLSVNHYDADVEAGPKNVHTKKKG